MRKEIKDKKCLCDRSLCAKCLSINCEDDDCVIHTVNNKIRAKVRTLKNFSLNKKEDIEKFQKEIDRLKK